MSQGVIELVGKRVAYANPAALFLLQISQENLIGSYLNEVLDPAAWERLAPIIENCPVEAPTEAESSLLQIHDRHIVPQCMRTQEDTSTRIVPLRYPS
jgi:hypothetical protein